MKNIKKIYCLPLVFSLALAFSSCEDWMKITPHGMMDQASAYDTERSTQRALNGLYIKLLNDDMYGKSLSCEMIELFALHYLTPSPHDYQDYVAHKYTNDIIKVRLSDCWGQIYKTIAYCNEFLVQIEKRKDKYPDANYRLYRGEAIGLRTLLHFDMLRLFGPVYAQDKDKPAIPYYDESTNDSKEILTAEGIMAKLMEDIDTAIELLGDDPILEKGIVENNDEVNFNTDFRNFRMNLYAAIFLKARMALYMGDNVMAYDASTLLLTGEMSAKFMSAFQFESKPIAARPIQENVYFTEQIFCLHNQDRDAIQKSLFSTELRDDKVLLVSQKYRDVLFGASNVGGADVGIRTELLAAGNLPQAYYCDRYAVLSLMKAVRWRYEIQSMMRLGELYLIAAEAAPDIESKRFYLESLRSKRGYKPDNTSGLSESKLNTVIREEFNKETFGDGQFFFFAKRKFLDKITSQNNTNYSMNKDKYVPPLPEGETNFRYDPKTDGELIKD